MYVAVFRPDLDDPIDTPGHDYEDIEPYTG